MAWGDPPVSRRGFQATLPAAEAARAAGYPLDVWSRLRLGLAQFLGELEPIDKALPREVHGVPVRGRERMQDFIDTFQPFVSRPSFGPQDAEEFLSAFGKRDLGLGELEAERASKLLEVYRNAIRKRNAPANFGFGEPEDEEPLHYLGKSTTSTPRYGR